MKTENTNPQSPEHIDGQILTGNNRETPKGHNHNVMVAHNENSFEGEDHNVMAACDENSFKGHNHNAMAAQNKNVFNVEYYNAMAALYGNVFDGDRHNVMAGYNRNAFKCYNDANIIACKSNNVITLAGTGNMVMAANGSKFKGKKGNAVCMIEFDKNKEKILNIKAAVIDGEILGEDTWYTFENGEFIEVKKNIIITKTENTNPQSPKHMDGQILTGNNRETSKGHNHNVMAAYNENSFEGYNQNAMAACDENSFKGHNHNAMAAIDKNSFEVQYHNAMAARNENSFEVQYHNAMAALDDNDFDGWDSNAMAAQDKNVFNVISRNVMAARDGNVFNGNRYNVMAGYNRNAFNCYHKANIIACKFDNVITLARIDNIVMAANGSKFKGRKGNAVCMVEFDKNREKILNVKVAVIDGKILKKHTWYTFENDEFIEVKKHTYNHENRKYEPPKP